MCLVWGCGAGWGLQHSQHQAPLVPLFSYPLNSCRNTNFTPQQLHPHLAVAKRAMPAGGGWWAHPHAPLSLPSRRFHRSLTDNNRWIRERSHESYAKNYSVVFPHDEPLAGRNARKDLLHEVRMRVPSRAAAWGAMGDPAGTLAAKKRWQGAATAGLLPKAAFCIRVSTPEPQSSLGA